MLSAPLKKNATTKGKMPLKGLSLRVFVLFSVAAQAFRVLRFTVHCCVWRAFHD